MTKDRLDELRAAQNDEDSTLLANSNDDGHLKIEVVSNITKYKVTKKDKENTKKQNDKPLDDVYNKVKELKELIEQIEDETISLRRIQSAVLQTVFQNNNHSKLEESMKTIKATSVKARNGLRELEAMKISLECKEGPHSRVILRVLCTQLPLLRKQYVNAMTGYQDALVTHKEKTENRIKEQLHIVDKDVTNEELEKMLDNQDTSVFVGNYMQEALDTRQKLQDARQRHKELLQLEIAITELHDMFIEMATLVESQGEVIDRIENYVSSGAELVESGKNELAKAKAHKERARKKKIFLAVCLGSILLTIILIVITELYFTFASS